MNNEIEKTKSENQNGPYTVSQSNKASKIDITYESFKNFQEIVNNRLR